MSMFSGNPDSEQVSQVSFSSIAATVMGLVPVRPMLKEYSSRIVTLSMTIQFYTWPFFKKDTNV